MGRMKIVINKCFGGFGISEEAIEKLLATDCKHISRHDPRTYFGGNDWEEKFSNASQSKSKMMRIMVRDGTVICDEHQDDVNRSCPHLVTVVEDLREQANGWAAELAVVDIPDGTEWEIDEYNGTETIHEKRRSWG